jgi:tetratricopeptide (TPR) repeat protein
MVFTAVPALPQMVNMQEASILRGELETNQPIVNGYSIKLYDLTRHATFETVNIRADGEFEFRQTPNGRYLLTVTDARGDSVYQSSITVGGLQQELIIRLPKDKTNQPASGPISLKQLQHPPSRKAFDAFRQAQKSGDAGDSAKAEQWLRKAIALSPDYGDAWLNLGARHMKAGMYQQSIGETQRGLEFSGPSALAYSNLSYALACLGREDEAKQSAEDALRLDPDDPRANYLFGLLLYNSHVNDAEAVRHLEMAAPHLSSARVMLAKIQAH